MNASKSIIAEMEILVSQMTPVVTITDNIGDGDNWLLSMCKTYWIIDCMELTIGGKIFEVVSFIPNESIIVSGAAQPVGTTFQLKAPDFVHGNRRKVAGERAKSDDLTNVFVYLPRPKARENKERDSDISYTAIIKPIFLGPYVADRDNTKDQQKDIIEPMNRMADLFETLIDDQDEVFNLPDIMNREERMDFGDPNVWGNEERIFNQKISGVELQMDLEVLREDVCECDGTPVDVCPDVTTSFQDVDTGVTTSPGQNIDFEVVDDGDLPIGTLEDNTPNKKKVRVISAAVKTVNFFRPQIAEVISQVLYDAPWRRINGHIPTLGATEFAQKLDETTPWKVQFDDSAITGITEHLYRLVGINGGYAYVEADGFTKTYKDKDGVASTENAVFGTTGNNMFIDRFTGIAYAYDDQKQSGAGYGPATYYSQMWLTDNFCGYTGSWFACSFEEARVTHELGTYDALLLQVWRDLDWFNFPGTYLLGSGYINSASSNIVYLDMAFYGAVTWPRSQTTATGRWYVPARTFEGWPLY